MTSYLDILHINEVLASYVKDKEGQASHKGENPTTIRKMLLFTCERIIMMGSENRK